MTDTVYAVLQRLRATRALTVLAHGDLDLLQRAAVVFYFQAGRQNLHPGWWRPLVPQDTDVSQAAIEHLGKVIEETLNDRVERPVSRTGIQGTHALPEACFLMLADSGADGSGAMTAVEDERLVIGPNLKEDAGADLVEALLAHTTDLRIAYATAGPDRLLLAHVLEDPRRRAGLKSYEAGGGLDRCEALACFRNGDDGASVFLPRHYAPAAGAFEAFLTLLGRAPGLLGGGRTDGRLAAVVESRSQELRAFPLTGLDFFDPSKLTPRLPSYVRLEVHRLESTPEALQTLRQRLEEPDQGLGGHRLYLCPSEPVEDPERALQRLEEEIGQLQQQREYLLASQERGPVLYRFDQEALPALADAVRCFPPGELQELGLEYAFQAVAEEPGGWHYLLCPPGAVAQERFLWWRWQDLLARPRGPGRALCFRLDPLWSRDYSHHGPGLSVFIPSGMRLFPSLHSWSPEKIDEHLRRMLAGGWFPRRPGLEVPEQGLCLIDGEVEDEELRVVVLPRDAFRPLTDELAWINDNLLLQHELGKMRRWIGELAGEARDRRVTDALRREAERARSDFEQTALATDEAVAGEASRLLLALRAELATLTRRGLELYDAIRSGHKELRKVEKVRGGTARDVKALRENVDGLAAAAQETHEELEKLDQRIRKVDRDWNEQRQKAEAQIVKLRREYEQARRRF